MNRVKLSSIKPAPGNPRLIKDEKFKKLCESIEKFPKMLELRPMVVDADGFILGGNMRYKALKHLGHKDIPANWIKRAEELTEEERQQFIIKDNVGFGEWDWDLLANEWNAEELADWGLDVWKLEDDEEVDYSILDDDEAEANMEEMEGNVRRAIQIEFEAEHYNEALKLVNWWRDQEAPVGAMILEYLRSEKQKTL